MVQAMGFIQVCSTFFILEPGWNDRLGHALLVITESEAGHTSTPETSANIALASENHTVKPKLKAGKVHSTTMRPIIQASMVSG